MAASSVVSSVPQHQVFLNFRGEDLRNYFISHLEKALREKHIRFFIDTNAAKGEHLDILFKEIEESRIALAIFSKGYTESNWCLNELVKIRERMDEGKLVTIPIFYLVEPKTVKHQEGTFGDVLRKKRRSVGDDQMKKWEGALHSVCDHIGFTFDGKSNENKFIEDIVEEVLKELNKIPSDESIRRSLDHSVQDTEVPFAEAETEIFGLKQRLSELEEMVDIKSDETRIVGVVGMHGIGKTTIVNEFFKTWKSFFVSHCLLQDISEIVKFNAMRLDCLPGMLLKEFLGDVNIGEEETYEPYKKKLLKNKVFIVLDGISDKTQIEVLLEGHREWTKKGSKIVIAANDRALLTGFVHDTDIFEVSPLNHRDGLKHFHRYAFSHDSAAHKNSQEKEDFMKVSKEFVRYARGHPLALQLLGEELCGKPVAYWKEQLNTLSPSIRDRVLKVSYDELSPKLKDAFLDIACFRSHDEIYVTSLLDSSVPEAKIIIKALENKFLIDTSDSSRVEMHDLLYTFAKELSSETNGKRRHQRDVNVMLRKRVGNENGRVVGIFLDLSQIEGEKTLDIKHFKKMLHLRYLKLYSSHCPQECKPNHKIHIPDGLDFPLEEVRCLHWLKYPLKELPPNFNPQNLVDLKLPYSEIEQIWKDKDAPKLKWVDLNHSSKLKTLLGISEAQNLQTLNLEGCTALETLDPDMQNMKSLVFLNLKGCTALESFPDIRLVSLKTLVLSNCSNLESFLAISESLEVLYMDGTLITELPTTMVKLVKLNLQDCKMLKKLPEDFDKLKALQELVCSGCSKLSSLPDVMKNMKCLQILLLDGTAITEIPHISSLERLCLSRINKIILSDGMRQLYQLKWLDLKYCKNLSSIPELPPNLLCLDAHGCGSLKTVANPVATHLPMEQIHSTFIFTNCNKLSQTAKKEITSYAQRKCQLLSDALKRCNEGSVPETLFSTCFPGCDVPSWFCHEAVGSVLKLKLPAHWNKNSFMGIALCAVVSFPNCQEQINSFSVTCKFNLEDGSRISFTRVVGRWNKHNNEEDKMTSDHVFICYSRCSNNIKCLEEQHSGTCTPVAASLEFGVTDEKARVEVLKCGLRLVYASDEPQKTKSDGTRKTDPESLENLTTDLQLSSSGSTPTNNGSSNSIASGSVSSIGEDSNLLDEAQSQTGR